jgi:Zn-dependent M32 family carboxypeptidase
MTYRDQCNTLHRAVVDKLSKYYKAEAAIKGSTNKELISDRNKKYKAWQEAQNKYNDFLTLVVRLEKTLDDKMEK